MKHLPSIKLKNAKYPTRWRYFPETNMFVATLQEIAPEERWGTRTRNFVIYNQTGWSDNWRIAGSKEPRNPLVFGLYEHGPGDRTVGEHGVYRTLREAQEASYRLLRDLFGGEEVQGT